MPAPEVFAFTPLIVFGGYVVFGISGFGSTLVSVPLLAHLLPLRFVVPMIVLLDCVASFAMGARLRAGIDKAAFRDLLPFMLTGMALGVALLVHLPGTALLLGLGVFVVIYGAHYALGRGPALRLPRWSAVPIGLLAGAISSAFGVGGPLYILYLTGRGADPDRVRATMPVIFIFTTVARIVLFAIAGLFAREVLLAAAALLPVMALGVWCGHRLHARFSREHVIRVVGGLLVASGASLILRSLAS
jgi:uncharacterized membrane protein YfcA